MSDIIKEIKTRTSVLGSRGLSPKLIQSLRSTNLDLSSSEHTKKNLELLEDKNTLYLFTGQQVGLFLGPCFTFYKAVTLIETAKEISKITNKNVIPMFWLQNEDHDFNEINHFYIPISDGNIKKIADEDSNLKTPVAHRFLKNNIEGLKKELKDSVFNLQEENFEVINKCYTENKSYSDAFKEFLAYLFSEDGLLFFDPRAKGVAELFIPVFETALGKHRSITESLMKNSAEQVKIIPNSPLFFYLHRTTNDMEERFRLEEGQDTWKLRGYDFNLNNKQLLNELENFPEKFSTTALLRPILQDSLFPNIGYIGGNAELEYFKQVDSIRNHFSQTPCLLIPRLTATIFEPSTKRLAEKLEITEEDLLTIKEEIIENIHSKLNPELQAANNLEQEIKSDLNKIYEKLSPKLKTLDANSLGNLERANEKVNSIYQAVLDKYKEKLKVSSTALEGRITKLKNNIFPLHQPQERVFSFIYFWLKYGFEFKNVIKSNFRPFSNEELKIKL